MRHGPANALSADEFFELVETLLGLPMAALGYHRIHGSVNDQPASRGRLTSTGVDHADAPFLWFEYGFEAGGEPVRRLVGPRDPESEDEWWVNDEPSTGRLELGDWRPVAKDLVDWDIWRDDGPCSVAEVERRLTAVGQAVLTFVQERGGFPVAP
jgi:hypothetical protein